MTDKQLAMYLYEIKITLEYALDLSTERFENELEQFRKTEKMKIDFNNIKEPIERFIEKLSSMIDFLEDEEGYLQND